MFKQTPKKLSTPLFKHLVKIRQNRRYREKHRSVIVSGKKVVQEIAEKVAPKKILLTTLDAALPLEGELYTVTMDRMKKITALLSPEGIAAEFPLPEPTSLIGKKRVLVLDQIADPGNLGTLIRTAFALGWEGIFFLPGCVDPFNDKVLRASRGALFSLPWTFGDWEKLALLVQQNKWIPYIADTEGEPLPSLTEKVENVLLLLSNEAHGVSTRGKELGKRISIPMQQQAESLNVAIAGAILMYQLIHGQ
ncbi:MAG: RNA methyltransferase [Chlamydiales bacterium]